MFENEQIKNRRWGQVSMESFKRIDEAILGISVFIGNLWEDANSMLNMKWMFAELIQWTSYETFWFLKAAWTK